MATTADIDTTAAVRKFLERNVVVPKEQEGADASEEIAALLETIALSFLLYPQMVLSLVQQARNLLLQVTTTEREVVEFMLGTLADLDNPSDPVADTSDLVEAQTALVDLGNQGRIQTGSPAYSRYSSAVQRFLDQQLALSLKRHARGELERSGQEAREDLYVSYGSLGSVHKSMTSRLHDLYGSVASFQGVDLTRHVAEKTVASVRDSLTKLQEQSSFLSKTVMAIEVLSGSAALQSISGSRGVYDPTVVTGTTPMGRILTIAAEAVGAALLFEGTKAVPPGGITLSVTVDGGSAQSLTIPELVFLFGVPIPASVTIPNPSSLFLNYYTTDPAQTTTLEVTLTTGARTRAQLATEIDAAMTSGGAIGGCVEANGRLLLTGSSGLNRLTVLGYGPGTYSGGYVPAPPSAHTLLGFSANQTSESKGILSPTGLYQWLLTYCDLAELDLLAEAVQLASPTVGAASQLELTGSLLALYDLVDPLTLEAEPSYLILQENGADLDPSGVGVYPGSRVTVLGDRGLSAQIISVDGTHLLFAGPLPRGTGFSTSILAPLVVATQALLTELARYDGAFADDVFNLQGVITPLLGKPTLAQVNDARRVISNLRQRLLNLKTALSRPQYVVREEYQQDLNTLRQLISGLQERNLDRAIEMLKRGSFGQFFGLENDGASKGSRFMKAMEEVGRNELSTTTRENEMEEQSNVAVSPDDNVYAGYTAGD